jgi:hypothetical protein
MKFLDGYDRPIACTAEVVLRAALIIPFFVWLLSVLIALVIGISVVGLVIAAPQLAFDYEIPDDWVAVAVLGALFAACWIGVRAYRRVKDWLSGKLHVDATAAGPQMTRRQRRLIALAVALVLFLGPVAIMMNCSGWNEGSMKVANCAVDFPLARSLADMFYGIVLSSAFILGLPILAYIGVCIGLLVALNRGLRGNSEDSAQPGFLATPPAAGDHTPGSP